MATLETTVTIEILKAELFLVLQVVDEATLRTEFQGVFTSEEKALVACKNDLCCIFRGFRLNEELPMETTPGPCWYPHRQPKPDNWEPK